MRVRAYMHCCYSSVRSLRSPVTVCLGKIGSCVLCSAVCTVYRTFAPHWKSLLNYSFTVPAVLYV